MLDKIIMMTFYILILFVKNSIFSSKGLTVVTLRAAALKLVVTDKKDLKLRPSEVQYNFFCHIFYQCSAYLFSFNLYYFYFIKKNQNLIN
jgi:hypothetical protein